MITPIRGRKQLNGFYKSYNRCLIRNDNPDKGTETISLVAFIDTYVKIRNDNPDKGTETNYPLYSIIPNWLSN